MTVLILHERRSVPDGTKPTYLEDYGHIEINPALNDDDFDAAVRTPKSDWTGINRQSWSAALNGNGDPLIAAENG
jgi:hypothetical protein